MSERMIAFIAAASFAIITHVSRAHAFDSVVEKRSFTLPSYVTVGGQPIKDIKIGWESYGSLNADKSNAILITHYFSATEFMPPGGTKRTTRPPATGTRLLGRANRSTQTSISSSHPTH